MDGPSQRGGSAGSNNEGVLGYPMVDVEGRGKTPQLGQSWPENKNIVSITKDALSNAM